MSMPSGLRSVALELWACISFISMGCSKNTVNDEKLVGLKFGESANYVICVVKGNLVHSSSITSMYGY